MPKSLFENVCKEAVFSKLFEKHAKNLHDFVYYKFGAQYNPQDKVQEAFIKLWERCKDVSPEKAKSFLFTVINNTTLNDIKHEKVVLKYNEKPVKTSTNESPEFIMEEQEYLQKYQNALAKLSDGQRSAFLLNRVEGKKHKEIAELLGISRKAVEKRIYTALQKLRQDLDEI